MSRNIIYADLFGKLIDLLICNMRYTILDVCLDLAGNGGFCIGKVRYVLDGFWLNGGEGVEVVML